MKNNATVDILGLTEEKELSSTSLPYLKHFNDRDYITNGREEEGILSITNIEINLFITDQREVSLPQEKLLFIDGEKTVSISYTSTEDSFIKNTYKLPFSCLLPLDKEALPDTINIYPMHIYPYLYDESTMCIHTHYSVAITFNNQTCEDIESISLFNPDEESL